MMVRERRELAPWEGLTDKTKALDALSIDTLDALLYQVR